MDKAFLFEDAGFSLKLFDNPIHRLRSHVLSKAEDFIPPFSRDTLIEDL